MMDFSFSNASPVYLEIGPTTLRALHGEVGFEEPLERDEDGRLTGPCKERLNLSLPLFLKKTGRPGRQQAYCAMGGRGVSLRRLTLPRVSKDKLRPTLRLLIESEFPLPPDELAWGYQVTDGQESRSLVAATTQDLLVVAVKKETVEDYAELLLACGLAPVFTLAAFARGRLVSRPAATWALLEVGHGQSELALFENGLLASIRILPWGDDHITASIGARLGLTPDDAKRLKTQLEQGVAPAGWRERAGDAVDAALDALGRAVEAAGTVPELYLTGKTGLQKDIAAGLTRRLQTLTRCEPLTGIQGEGRSAAILGLKKTVEEDGLGPSLVLQVKPTNGVAGRTRPARHQWAALAVLLALASLSFPYAEAVFLKARLAHRLVALNADRGRLGTLDRELDFLRFLKLNAPPCLDALYLLSKSAPQGTRIDSFSLSRRGDLSLRGSFRDGAQVTDFRSKLIDSGFFATVVVEEQTPTPDRQKVTVRITAQLKPATDRESLVIGPTAAESAKPKPGSPEPSPGVPPTTVRPVSPLPPGGASTNANPAPASPRTPPVHIGSYSLFERTSAAVVLVPRPRPRPRPRKEVWNRGRGRRTRTRTSITSTFQTGSKE